MAGKRTMGPYRKLARAVPPPMNLHRKGHRARFAASTEREEDRPSSCAANTEACPLQEKRAHPLLSQGRIVSRIRSSFIVGRGPHPGPFSGWGDGPLSSSSAGGGGGDPLPLPNSREKEKRPRFDLNWKKGSNLSLTRREEERGRASHFGGRGGRHRHPILRQRSPRHGF